MVTVLATCYCWPFFVLLQNNSFQNTCWEERDRVCVRESVCKRGREREGWIYRLRLCGDPLNITPPPTTLLCVFSTFYSLLFLSVFMSPLLLCVTECPLFLYYSAILFFCLVLFINVYLSISVSLSLCVLYLSM